jgi:Flp pilus assembly protein TadD
MSDSETPHPDAEIAALFDDASGDIAIGDLPAAIEKYRICVQRDPQFFEAWHALGMALMKNNEIDAAIDAGLQATRLRPNDQLAWSSLSLFYVRANRIKEAEAAGTKARILSWGAKLKPESDAESHPQSPSAS